MKKTLIAVCALAFGAQGTVRAAEPPSSAGHSMIAKTHLSKVVGPVDSTDTAANKISIKTQDGKVESFSIGKDTKLQKGSKAIELSGVKQGERVLVRFDPATHAAKRITLLSSTPGAHPSTR